jgi:CubicO group peptidase (beta-lactamase class C family)
VDGCISSLERPDNVGRLQTGQAADEMRQPDHEAPSHHCRRKFATMQTLSEVLAEAVGGFRAPGVDAVIRITGAEEEEVSVGVQPGQLFEIGSIAKTMTALLVLQHVQQMEIALDDPITAYLPDFCIAVPGATERVTIRHLLTHTSGLDCGDDFTDTGDGDDCLERYVAEVLPGVGFLHEPGARWSYCNGGYSILGRLIEVLDGRPFDDALISRVLRPLGLEATTTARLRPGQWVTPGHRFDPTVGALVPESGRMPRSAGPAGNVVATAMDLANYAEDLFSGHSEILDAQLVQQMLRPQVPLRNGSQGLAWVLPSPNLAMHGGGTRGSTAFLAASPAWGSVSVVANGPGAGAIIREVRAHLLGTTAAHLQPGPGPGPHVEPETCVGTYARRHAQVEISLQGGVLVASANFFGAVAQLHPTPEAVVLKPAGGGRFLSSRYYEDGFGVWDFDDLRQDGVPMRLLTTRLLNREGSTLPSDGDTGCSSRDEAGKVGP